MPERARVLVSGGSGGIGNAVCLALADAGYRPMVGYSRNEAGAVDLARRCDGAAVPLDLSDERSIGTALDRVVGENARWPLAGVVLAASPPPEIAPFTRIDSASLARQWQVNVAGPQRLLAGLIKHCFAPRKSGVVIGVLSRAIGAEQALVTDGAVRPAAARSMSAYIIGKIGQAGLLSAVAAEYPWLRVRAVCPGYTRTAMLAAFDARFLEMQERTEPFRTPEQVAVSILQEIVAP